MNTRTKLTHRWQFWIAAVLFGVLLPLLGIQTTAQAADIASVGVEQNSNSDGGGHGHPGEGDKDDNEFRGLIQEMPGPTGGTATLPATLIGVWKISDKFVTTTEQTEFNQEFGAFFVGGCVKVHLEADGVTVRELETERAVQCTGDDDDEHNGQPHGELFATIVSFPPDPFIGDWVFQNITVTAGITTEFSQKNGSFSVGTLVKVEFIVNPDEFLATEIKTAISPDGEDDDHHHGHHGHHDEMHDAKAFGILNAFTTTLPSIWDIGGITYTVDISTELDTRHGRFEISQTVKVEYTVADGIRTATEIKSMPAGAGGSKDGHFKLVGFVTESPLPSSFVGNWIIGGVPLTTDLTTRFEEEHGILNPTAYVEVEYSMKNGVPVISKLETRVPPGAGDDDHAGIVEQMDDDSMAAAVGANSTWRIGGNAYTVTPATSVSSGVTLNNLAVVNSYTAADGSQVATRISSVTLNSLLFLPATRK